MILLEPILLSTCLQNIFQLIWQSLEKAKNAMSLSVIIRNMLITNLLSVCLISVLSNVSHWLHLCARHKLIWNILGDSHTHEHILSQFIFVILQVHSKYSNIFKLNCDHCTNGSIGSILRLAKREREHRLRGHECCPQGIGPDREKMRFKEKAHACSTIVSSKRQSFVSHLEVSPFYFYFFLSFYFTTLCAF